MRSSRLERKEQTVKLSKLAYILNAIEAASYNADVRVYLNEKPRPTSTIWKYALGCKVSWYRQEKNRP
jgi:hypothetical protein